MRIIKIVLIACLPLFAITSCKKFLDVSASNQVLQEDMFSDGTGVRVALNGVYKLLSNTELYGKNLTWGFASALGYNYEFNNLPYNLREAASFNWANADAMNVTEQVWSRAYNVLANCNNIIQEVEKKDSSFFPEKNMEKNMILGEMYGIRALVHFDLLRIFSPSPVTGYTGTTIPYVKNYPEYQPVPLDMARIFSEITTDMEKAKTLLASIDTVTLRSSMRSGVGRIRNAGSWITLPQGDFFNYRGQRLNFFAATSLLARIFLYKGDYENAEKNAKLVYDYQKRNWFQWTSSIYQGQITDLDFIHIKRPDEILLGFSNNRNFEIYEESINPQGSIQLYYRMSSSYVSKLFEGDLDDYRLVGWYNRHGDQRYITWRRPQGSSYNATQVAQNQESVIPVLRFSEMYHILIECHIQKNRIADAVTILNDLRTNRGAKARIASTISKTDLMEVLVNDIIRETLTEGQAFYMFKRLNRNIFNGNSNRIMKPNEWFSPLPQSETAYQL